MKPLKILLAVVALSVVMVIISERHAERSVCPRTNLNASSLQAEKRPEPIARKAEELRAESDNSAATNSFPPVALSPAAKKLLNSEYKNRRPGPDVLSELQDSDRPALISEFEKQSLTNKTHTLWALAYLGGPEVQEVFLKTIEADYSAYRLNLDEMYAILDIAYGLGHLAKEDSVSFDYLREHMKPESWIGVRKWEVDDSGVDANKYLSDSIIQSIGLSGREEASQALDEVLQWDKAAIKQIIGGFVSAQCYLTKSKTMDRKAFVKFNLAASWVNELYEWYATEEGKRWKTWSKEFRE